MLLPAHLTGSYQRYKANTTIFTTWLFHTASACGYSFEASRKHTRQPAAVGTEGEARYVVPVSELQRQAVSIANSGHQGLQIPRSIERVAEHAIEGRKSFTTMLNSVRHDKAGDASHKHFVETLEHTLNTLTEAKQRILSSQTNAVEQPNVTAVNNMFNHLELEEVVSDAEDLYRPLKSPSSTNTTQTLYQGRYELQDGDGENIDFVLQALGFFQDLHNIESFVTATWKDYQLKKCSLCNAALVTNAALCLANKLEEDICAALSLSEERSHYEVLAWIILGRRPQNSDDATVISSAFWLLYTQSPASKFLYINSFWILMNITTFIQETSSRGSCFYRTPRFDQRFQELFTRMSQAENPGNVANSRASDEFREEETLVTRLFNANLSIHGFNIRMRSQLPINKRVLELDEFSRAVAKVPDDVQSIQVSFAFTVMGKVHRILEKDQSRPRLELCNTMEPTLQSIRYMDPDEPRGRGPYWTEKDSPSALILKQFSYITMSKIDSVYHEGAQWVEQRDKVDGKAVAKSFDQQENVVLELNPLYCGTMLLNFTLAAENAGILLANHHLSVLFVAQLYNAFQQKQLLKENWPDVEKVINVHLDSIFFGSRPTTAKQVHLRFCLRNGLSVLDYDKSRKMFVGPGTKRDNSKRSPACLQVSKVSQALNAMLDGKETRIRTMFALNQHMEKERALKENRRTTSSNTTFNTISFLTRLKDWFALQESAIHIPYITLTKQCSGLLQHILDSKKITLPRSAYDPANYRRPWGDLSHPPNSQNLVFVHLMQQILWEDKERELAEPEMKKNGQRIMNASDLEKAAGLARKWMVKQGLVKKG